MLNEDGQREIDHLKMPKAVIFDWDNTLVDTWPLIHNALYLTFEKYGLTPWTLDETKARVAHSLRDGFPVLFGDRWQEAGRDYQQFYQATHLERLAALPLSEELLKALKEAGVYLAVVSNKKGHNLRAEAEHIGWAPYFQKLVGSDDAGQDKPHPAPVALALENSGIIPGEEVWFIGDTAVDLECAKNTQCVPILFGEIEAQALTYEGAKAQYKGLDAHYYAVDHNELLGLFRRLA